jgi:MFS family permease
MEQKSKTQIKLAIIFISLTQGLQYSISPVLGMIRKEYPDINVSVVQMLITAPAMLAMVIALISGWLVIKISKKKILLFGALEMGICGFLPLLSNSFMLLFTSRTLLGVGLGIVTALNTAVVAEHFEGKERIATMGLQGAAVGTGMLLSTTLGGILGANNYQGAYWVHLLGFISTVVIMLSLPETGKVKITAAEKLKLNKDVYRVCLLGAYEFLFLITFTTNIAMHLRGSLAGNASISGILTGVFSGVQIAVGLVLGYICKYTQENTLPVAMLSYGVGSLLLILFPGSYALLLIGAVFCGMSQGIFIPRAMSEVSSAVKPNAAALASAAFTVSICIAQTISPTVLNTVSKIVFGAVTTTDVYIICLAAMTIAPIAIIFKQRKAN